MATISESNHKGPLEGLVLVDHTVKFTNQVMEEKRRLQDENEQLRLKLDNLTKANESAVDKEKFYEGASWVAKEAVVKSEIGVKRYEEVRQEYRTRVTNAKDTY